MSSAEWERQHPGADIAVHSGRTAGRTLPPAPENACLCAAAAFQQSQPEAVHKTPGVILHNSCTCSKPTCESMRKRYFSPGAPGTTPASNPEWLERPPPAQPHHRGPSDPGRTPRRRGFDPVDCTHASYGFVSRGVDRRRQRRTPLPTACKRPVS